MTARASVALLADGRDDVEAVAVAEPHVDHRIGRRIGARLGDRLLDALGRLDHEAAAFHGARQPGQERLVVIDDQQRGVVADQPLPPVGFVSTVIVSVPLLP